MDVASLIALWRDRASEAHTQAEQFQDGSITHTMLLTIAETYERLAAREASYMPTSGGIRSPPPAD